MNGAMSAIGTQRTIQPHQRLSAIGPKRTKLIFAGDGLSALGQKRKCAAQKVMSAKCQ